MTSVSSPGFQKSEGLVRSFLQLETWDFKKGGNPDCWGEKWKNQHKQQVFNET